MSNCFFALPRKLVSQNKRRYQQDGYDLDLCYLHPRIIVMGFPSVGMEVMYRNPRSQVQRFLTERHGDHYKVYNFCSEKNRQYSSDTFDGRVAYCPIEDHNVPTLQQAITFCEDAMTWLLQDAANVAVLHCKAGKGRAGMMACMLLVRYENHMASCTPQEAIDQYNRTRVEDGRGLTVVSQKRWVHYYGQVARNTGLSMVEPSSLWINTLLMENTLTGVEPPILRLRIFTLDSVTAEKKLAYQAIGGDGLFQIHVQVHGAVLIEFKRIQCQQCVTKKYVKVWFHTLFVKPSLDKTVTFTRKEMDWVSKDKKMRMFPAAFEIRMIVDHDGPSTTTTA